MAEARAPARRQARRAEPTAVAPTRARPNALATPIVSKIPRRPVTPTAGEPMGGNATGAGAGSMTLSGPTACGLAACGTGTPSAVKPPRQSSDHDTPPAMSITAQAATTCLPGRRMRRNQIPGCALDGAPPAEASVCATRSAGAASGAASMRLRKASADCLPGESRSTSWRLPGTPGTAPAWRCPRGSMRGRRRPGRGHRPGLRRHREPRTAPARSRRRPHP